MRYCGNCGAELHERELAVGVCPVCYTRITAEGNVREDSPTDSAAQTLPDVIEDDPAATLQRLSGRHAISPEWTRDATTRSPFLPRSLRWLVLGGSAALIVLVFLTTLLIINGAPDGMNRNQGNGVSSQQTATGTANAINKTPRPGKGTPTRTVATATVNATQTTASPTIPPTIMPTPTNTPTPVPADLVVTPTTSLSFTTLQCTTIGPGVTATFTVMNAGAVRMDWTATSSNSAYLPSPGSGSLDGQQQTSVSITQIHQTFSVTFAGNAQNSPQKFTITCGGS